MANRNIENILGEVFVPGAAPSTPVEGLVYYDATSHALQVRGAAAWTTPMMGNAAITAGTNTKITYDAKGLVTAGVAATTADIADSTNRRYVTDAQLVVVGNTAGTNTGNVTLAAVGAVPNANGASVTGQVVNLQPASASFPGALLAADFVKLSNLSGTNSGNVTLTGVGVTPNANGATLTGQALNLELASAAYPGLITAAQFTKLANTSGTNTGDQNLSGYALLSGAAFTGAVSATSGGAAAVIGTHTGSQAGVVGSSATGVGGSFHGNATRSALNLGPQTLPSSAAQGDVYYDSTSTKLRYFNGAWVDCSTAMGTFGSAPNANGGTITAGVLTLQPANGTYPGGVSTTAQTFAGDKTFANIISPTVYNTNGTLVSHVCVKTGTTVEPELAVGTLLSVRVGIGTGLEAEVLGVTRAGVTATGWMAASNLSGTNTGDVSIGAFGSTPDAKGLSLSGQTITAQPADATHPGMVTTAPQTFGGSKTFSVATGTAVTGSGGSIGLSGSGTTYGVVGTSNAGYGGHFMSTGGDSVGVYGTGPIYGVQGLSSAGSAIYGSSSTGVGAEGFSASSYGVYGHSTSSRGVYGDGVYGVYGNGTYAVYGNTTDGAGLYGIATSGYGCYAQSGSGTGLDCISGTGTALNIQGNNTKAPIHIKGTTAPASPTVGDMYFDGTTLYIYNMSSTWRPCNT